MRWYSLSPHAPTAQRRFAHELHPIDVLGADERKTTISRAKTQSAHLVRCVGVVWRCKEGRVIRQICSAVYVARRPSQRAVRRQVCRIKCGC